MAVFGHHTYGSGHFLVFSRKMLNGIYEFLEQVMLDGLDLQESCWEKRLSYSVERDHRRISLVLRSLATPGHKQ